MHSPIDKEMALEEFARYALEDDSPEAVSIFMKKYPEYSDDIVEYAVALLINKHSADEPFLNSEERVQFLKKATEIFQSKKQSPMPALTSLLKRITEIGLNTDQFKAKTGLTQFILLNLDQKLVDVSSIPSKILDSISQTLSIPGEVLNSYLAGKASPGQAMNYKAYTAPSSSDRISFEEVLRQDSSISEQERLKLME